MILFLFFIGNFFCIFHSLAQEPLLMERPIFDRKEIRLQGRLRHLTLEDIDHDNMQEIIILERYGVYPDWHLELSVWHWQKQKNNFSKYTQIVLPTDTIFYDFCSFSSQRPFALLLMRQKNLEVWLPTENKWVAQPLLQVKIEPSFSSYELGQAQPIDMEMFSSESQEASRILIPLSDSVALYSLSVRGLALLTTISVPLKAYYKSSVERQPFDVSYWFRSTLWYASPLAGTFQDRVTKRIENRIFFPWMDEVFVVDPTNAKNFERIIFSQMTEIEREDAKTYVVTQPVDLNGDRQTDFVVNKFQGAATDLRAKTEIFITQKDSTIPKQGLLLEPQGNRAAGTIAIDLNKDEKMDLVTASSNFSLWTIVRALVKGQVSVLFSFYMAHSNGYHLKKPDFQREILFGFSLKDLAIDGLLPTLQGDFNGDGYPDALYACNRTRFSFLIQKPMSKDFFPAVPSGIYDVDIPHFYRIGTMNEDSLSDIVLYDRESAKNQLVTVLINQGLLH